MSQTIPNHFIELIKKIPKERLDQFWLFPIRQNQKVPDVPAGTILHRDNMGNAAYRLSVGEAIKRLKWGKNVGIYGVYGSLMFLDLDAKDGKLLASQSFLDALESNPTFTVQTPSGGRHLYFWNDGIFPNQICKDIDGNEIWSLRANWYYVLGVGSYASYEKDGHKYDDSYRIIQNLPIAQFQSFGEYFKKNEEVKTEVLKTFTDIKEKQEISLAQLDINLKKENSTRRKMLDCEFKYIGIRYLRSKI